MPRRRLREAKSISSPAIAKMRVVVQGERQGERLPGARLRPLVV